MTQRFAQCLNAEPWTSTVRLSKGSKCTKGDGKRGTNRRATDVSMVDKVLIWVDVAPTGDERCLPPCCMTNKCADGTTNKQTLD